jgi:APA family basic amino acid/polyamine antiporter
MIILLIYKPAYTFPGLAIVILGIPVFYIWKKYSGNHGKSRVSEEDGEE